MTATESSPSPLAHWANADIPRAPSVNFFADRSAALSARLSEPRPLRLTLLSSPTARRAAQRRERVLVRKRHIATTPSPHRSGRRRADLAYLDGLFRGEPVDAGPHGEAVHEEAQRDRDADRLRDPVLEVLRTVFDHYQAQDHGAEAARAEPSDEQPVFSRQVGTNQRDQDRDETHP